MTSAPDAELSPMQWVRSQTEQILAAGDTKAASIDGMDVVLLTTTGAKTGKKRLVPLMRVEHDGTYAIVASKGGAPDHPQWYANILAHPDIEIMDGTRTTEVTAREVDGAEREQWWQRAVAAFPPYAEYQTKTDRVIPVLLLEPRGS